MIDEQERLARDLAEILIGTQETNVTKQQLDAMNKWDVYDWLEAWDFSFEDGDWKYIE